MQRSILLIAVLLSLWSPCQAQNFNFDQGRFCNSMEEIYANSVDNFSRLRRPDWRSTTLFTYIDGYETKHESTITGDDSTYVQFHYRMFLNASKRKEAQEAMQLFEKRLLACINLVALSVVKHDETADRDSLHAIPESEDRFRDLGVSIYLEQSEVNKHDWWLHVDVTNTLKHYSFAADLAEHKKSNAEMAAAIESDRKNEVPKSPDNNLCSAMQRLIAQRSFCWSEIKREIITRPKSGGELWNTAVAILNNRPVFMATTPVGDTADHLVSCGLNSVLIETPSWDEALGAFNFYAGEINHCTVEGSHPTFKSDSRDGRLKEWILELMSSGKKLRILLKLGQNEHKKYYILWELVQVS